MPRRGGPDDEGFPPPGPPQRVRRLVSGAGARAPLVDQPPAAESETARSPRRPACGTVNGRPLRAAETVISNMALLPTNPEPSSRAPAASGHIEALRARSADAGNGAGWCRSPGVTGRPVSAEPPVARSWTPHRRCLTAQWVRRKARRSCVKSPPPPGDPSQPRPSPEGGTRPREWGRARAVPSRRPQNPAFTGPMRIGAGSVTQAVRIERDTERERLHRQDLLSEPK